MNYYLILNSYKNKLSKRQYQSLKGMIKNNKIEEFKSSLNNILNKRKV